MAKASCPRRVFGAILPLNAIPVFRKLEIAWEGQLSRAFEAGNGLSSVRLHSLGWEAIFGQEVGLVNYPKMGDGIGRKIKLHLEAFSGLNINRDVRYSIK